MDEILDLRTNSDRGMRNGQYRTVEHIFFLINNKELTAMLTLIPAATTGGGRLFEKRYGRPLWRNKSINSFGPVV
jgi:hypothetical protein